MPSNLPGPSRCRRSARGVIRLACHGIACLVVVLACGEPADPDDGGSPVSRSVAIGDTVIQNWNSASTHDYYFHSEAGVAVSVLGDAILDDFVIRVTDSATGAPLATTAVPRHPPHPSYQLADFHTPMLEVGPGQTIRIRLTRGAPRTSSGRYRLALAAVVPSPENHAARLALGDTVNGETMSSAVDVDRFFLKNASGAAAELAVFVQSRAGHLQVTIRDSASGARLESAPFTPDHTVRPVPQRRVPTISLATGQTITIEVLQLGAGSGPYQLYMYPVNRAPESLPATIALNDTIQGESLENSADIDEFTVVVSGGAYLIGYYEGLGAPADVSGMSLSGPGLPGARAANAPSASLEERNTGTFIMGQGGTLTITHSTLAAELSGPYPYRFMIRHINTQPEHHAQAVAIGDSIVGETIGYIGDIDIFSFSLSAGQTVTASVRALDGFPVNPVYMRLTEEAGGWYAETTSTDGRVGSLTFTPTISTTYYLRLESRFSRIGTGGYEVVVQ